MRPRLKPARSLPQVPPTRKDGCYWDRLREGLVMSRTISTPGTGPVEQKATVVNARYSAMCVQSSTKTKARVSQKLLVGMPQTVNPYSRSLTATMRAVGYPATEQIANVVIVGNMFVSDKERVPFPEGHPLTVLHDPPGGESYSAFENARATVTFTERGNTVQGGLVSELDGGIGVSGMESGDTETCAGIGAMVCSLMVKGADMTLQAVGHAGLNKLSERGALPRNQADGPSSTTTVSGQFSSTLPNSNQTTVSANSHCCAPLRLPLPLAPRSFNTPLLCHRRGQVCDVRRRVPP